MIHHTLTDGLIVPLAAIAGGEGQKNSYGNSNTHNSIIQGGAWRPIGHFAWLSRKILVPQAPAVTEVTPPRYLQVCLAR